MNRRNVFGTRGLLILINVFIVVGLFSQPIIRSFTPVSAPVGGSVIVNGTGFSNVAANNIVYFGAVRAIVASSTDTTLNVIVPAGATFKPITVTTNNLTAYSINSFALNYSGSSGPFTTNSFSPKISVTTGGLPHYISPADFNGDGKIDLLVTRGSSNNVTVLTNTTSSGNISFGIPLNFPANNNEHEGSATGDFDGDGKIDFVITNSFNSHSISVYRNTSSGSIISFALRLDYAADNTPYLVAVGDLNGDGKPDIAAANAGSSKISVYKNNSTLGNISFSSRIDLPCGTSPYGIAIGDLDGDGKADMAITTQNTSASLSVMKNTGSGGIISFDPPVDFAAVSGAFEVAIADVDGDGKPELAAASAGVNAILVIKNTSSPGNLAFGSLNYFNAGSGAQSVDFADLDGDGRPDMVVANRNAHTVSALRNISVGGYINFENHVDYSVGQYPLHAAAADLDGDNRPDIAVANSSEDTISILKSFIGSSLLPTIISFTPSSGTNGTVISITGTNFTGATSVTFGGVNASSFIVNSPNNITAVVGYGATGIVSVTTPNGTASLSGFNYNIPVITSLSNDTGRAGTSLVINGNNFGLTPSENIVFFGAVKASITNASSSQISVIVPVGATYAPVSVTCHNLTAYSSSRFSQTFQNDSLTLSSTSFAPPLNYGIGNYPYYVTLCDLNDDGKPEVISANSLANSISILKNISTPGYVSFNSKMDISTGTDPHKIATGDLDGDGKPEIAVSNFNRGGISTMSIFTNTSSAGTISFAPKQDFATGNGTYGIEIGDLNGDGKPDIATTSANSSFFSVFINTSQPGQISFSARQDYIQFSYPTDLVIADADNDGIADLIVLGFSNSEISVYRNTSTGGILSFAPKKVYSISQFPYMLRAGDFDYDGKVDIAVASPGSSGGISFFTNISTPSNLNFAPQVFVPVNSIADISFSDLNGNGIIDLVSGKRNTGEATVIQNYSTTAGAVSFGNPFYFNTGTYDTFSATGDVDGDGRPDLVIANTITNTVSILRNVSGKSLPVTLVSFNGRMIENKVALKWMVENEINFSHYEIERSNDGFTFVKVGELKGGHWGRYSYTDNNEWKQKVAYYRLKIVDLDGRYVYSKIVEIKISQFHNITIYPNPANAFIRLLNVDEDITVEIINADGKLISKKTFNATNRAITISTEQFPAGTYNMKLTTKEDEFSKKFVIVK